MSFLRPSVPKPLRDSPLGSALPTTELRRLRQLSTIVDIAEGDTIISEATPGRECFVVIDGEFAVNSNAVSAELGAGEVAGELALLTGRPRNASVVAATDAAVCVMHPREFATLLSEAHQFRSRVMTSAYDRLNDQSVALPAQFVRKYDSTKALATTWSDRLSRVPTWSSDS